MVASSSAKSRDLADCLDPTGDLYPLALRRFGPGKRFVDRAVRALPELVVQRRRALYGTRIAGRFERSTRPFRSAPSVQLGTFGQSALSVARNCSTSIFSCNHSPEPGNSLGGQSNQPWLLPSPSSGLKRRTSFSGFLPKLAIRARRACRFLMQNERARKRHCCREGGHPRRRRQRWPQDPRAFRARFLSPEQGLQRRSADMPHFRAVSRPHGRFAKHEGLHPPPARRAQVVRRVADPYADLARPERSVTRRSP